ncbi:hypothetical protein ACA910_011930 [Epithemia clementina (nom. ined.)]
MATTILQNAHPLKRRRRSFMDVVHVSPKLPGTPVWIFILLFVVIVFWILLSTTSDTMASTTTTDNFNNKNNNNHDGHDVDPKVVNANMALHEATAGLGQQLRHVVQTKRQQFQQALSQLAASGTTSVMPQRLKALRDKHEIIGERLIEIQQGQETAEELLHSRNSNGRGRGRRVANHPNAKQQALSNNGNHHKKKKSKKNKNIDNKNKNTADSAEDPAMAVLSDKPPMELDEIITFLNGWIHELHETLNQVKHATFEGIWQAYHDLTVKTLYPWDQEYLQRMPERRDDGSIFLSLASYRDETCFTTLYNAYAKAQHPDQLFVGLVQQNCHENCKSGVLANGTVEDVPPDDDCYAKFCASDIGQVRCNNQKKQQVRLLDINESESLGPYAARYLTSKLWYGESWFMQIDAHMTFAQNWDALSVAMLNKAPSTRPVLSHYPPAHTIDLETRRGQPSSRLCGPVFSRSDLENQIIRLEGGAVWDKQHQETPLFAPFTAAGYFVSHSRMLKEVPFDPFLPWIFMGEEIIMSSRLWTSGYDIFSPTQSVVGHWYVRRHKPKFWESVHRAFTVGVHNPLQMHILDRVRYQMGYPEAAPDLLSDRTILTAVESYTMGRVRPLSLYLTLVGLNMTTKEVTPTHWCENGFPPPGFEQYNHLYPDGMARKTKGMDKYMEKYAPPPAENDKDDDFTDDDLGEAEEGEEGEEAEQQWGNEEEEEEDKQDADDLTGGEEREEQ